MNYSSILGSDLYYYEQDRTAILLYQFSEQQAARPVQQVITVPAPTPSQPAAPQQYSGAQYYHNQQPVSPVIYSISLVQRQNVPVD